MGSPNIYDADLDTVATYALKADDIVINRVNSMTHLGKSMVVSQSLNGVLFESNMMRSRLSPSIDSDYVGLYLGSELGRKRLTCDAKWAVNQASINQQDVKKTPIPVPSAKEQQEVSEMVTRLLAAADAQVKAITQSLKQSAAQRKNILQAAFSGQLVPQDPFDEPASALLARIRAERAARETGAARGRGKK
jgi:type I restriction enzyme S subunit